MKTPVTTNGEAPAPHVTTFCVDRPTADAYCRFWQGLTADTLDGVDTFMAPEIRFRDPFNDVRGLDRVKALFAHLYSMLAEVSITVDDIALSGPVAYLKWRFVYRLKSGQRFEIVGMSEVHFGPDGKATAHLDHWDAASQFWEQIPVIGFVLRQAKKRLSV